MYVLRTIPTFFPHVTGPANQAYEVATRLQDRGHQTKIITTTRNSDNVDRDTPYKGIPVTRCPTMGSFMQYDFAPKAYKEIKKADPDIIHSHSYRNFLSDIGYFYAWKNDLPFVLHNHGSFLQFERILENGKWPYKFYDFVTRKQVGKGANAVFVSTRKERQQAINFGISKESIFILPVGKDPSKYSGHRKEQPKDEFRLLFVGRLTADRNVEQAIAALQYLNDEVHLRVVGGEEIRSSASRPNYLKSLQELTEELAVEDRVEFVGPKYDDELVTEYRSAHAFIYTSYSENFGQTILEAAAASLPIISTPVGVAPDVIQEGENGYLVDFNSPKETAKYIRRLGEGNLSQMAEKSRTIVEDRYAWDEIVDQYIDIYQKFL